VTSSLSNLASQPTDLLFLPLLLFQQMIAINVVIIVRIFQCTQTTTWHCTSLQATYTADFIDVTCLSFIHKITQ